ncbi:MAG TPA: FkbM family methyltransferase [Burkholderiales bacterium]
MFRRLRKLVYRLGLRSDYHRIDRLHYLKRLARAGSPGDSSYASDKDVDQFREGEVLVAEAFDGREVLFFCDPANHTEREVIKAGFSSSVLRLAADLAASGEAVIDVGANVGALAVPLAKSRPALEVHAFEPHRLALGRLRRNIAANRLANIVVHEQAAGNAAGTAELTAFELRDLGLSSLRASASRFEGQSKYAVPVVTLDEALRDLKHKIAVIKIDVEGFEAEVLEGARGIVARDRPYLIFEHSDVFFEAPGAAAAQKRRLASLLESFGYEAFYITRHSHRLLLPVLWDKPLTGDVLAMPAR